MKAKVIKRFYGELEQHQFEVGDMFEGTKERIDYINDKLPGYLEAVAARPRKKAADKTEEA